MIEMKCRKNKYLSIKQQFLNNPLHMISINPLFKNSLLIPLLPIEKNIFVIYEKKANLALLQKEIYEIPQEISWINKDIYTHAWKSITLKSKDGLEQDYLEESFLGTGEDNTYQYTTMIKFFPFIKKLLESLETDIYLVRILKLNARGKIKYHTDEIVFKKKFDIIRCHLPIITDYNIKFKIGYPLNPPSPTSGSGIWNAESIFEKYLEPGYLWYTNVNCLHSVENNTNIDRIHLVIDLKPTETMLKNIFN